MQSSPYCDCWRLLITTTDVGSCTLSSPTPRCLPRGGRVTFLRTPYNTKGRFRFSCVEVLQLLLFALLALSPGAMHQRCTVPMVLLKDCAPCAIDQPIPSIAIRERRVPGLPSLSAEGGWSGWVGSRLAPKAVSHGLCDLTSPARLGPYLRLSGLTAAQTADDPRTSPRCW